MFVLIRSLLFTIPAAFLTTAILIWFTYLASLVDRKYIDSIFRLWARCVMRVCGARPHVKGLENLDTTRNYIIVSNHLSLIDSPLLVWFLPLPVRFLGKKELFSVPVMGAYMARAGHIPIDRGNARAALQSMADAAKLLAEGTRSLLIYPEGTRSPDGRLQDFKDGAALLAIRSGLPVLPCAVRGTRDVLPAKGCAIRSGDVELRIGAPIETAGLTAKDRAPLTELLRQRVAALIQESHALQ
jgi:1-acyl-sn-glycerol-3-phosphate acyltransferase